MSLTSVRLPLNSLAAGIKTSACCAARIASLPGAKMRPLLCALRVMPFADRRSRAGLLLKGLAILAHKGIVNKN